MAAAFSGLVKRASRTYLGGKHFRSRTALELRYQNILVVGEV